MILKKDNIHGDKALTRRQMEVFIASLMQRVTNKNICLSSMGKLGWVRAMVMNIGCASEYLKRNIRNEAGTRI